MRSLAIAALLACGLVACAGQNGEADPSADREVSFSCANGESLRVRFSPRLRVAILIRHGGSIELAQQPAASGFLYSNGRSSIRGKGDDLTVESGRRAPVRCTADRVADRQSR